MHSTENLLGIRAHPDCRFVGLPIAGCLSSADKGSTPPSFAVCHPRSRPVTPKGPCVVNPGTTKVIKWLGFGSQSSLASRPTGRI
jgi:hypothetical protein